VDLPTLGRPTMTMDGSFRVMAQIRESVRDAGRDCRQPHGAVYWME
jgi:hypothetical protein